MQDFRKEGEICSKFALKTLEWRSVDDILVSCIFCIFLVSFGVFEQISSQRLPCTNAGAFSEPCQTPSMHCFVKTVNG